MTSINDIDITVADTETTGLVIGKDRIIEFGATLFRNRRITGRGRFLCNPGIPIDPDAQKVHGISNERVQNCPTFADLLPRIRDNYERAGLIVGFNSNRFDNQMIDAEAARVGSDWRVPVDKSLDILTFVNWFHRGDRPRTQEAIGPKYGLSFVGAAHSAAADTQMTGELLYGMVDAGIIPDVVEDALAEQARLAPIIEAEFEAWGPWIYRDRNTRRYRMGAGKHCGKYLVEVSKGTIGWYLANIDDLSDQTRAAFEAVRDGKNDDDIQMSMFAVSGDNAGVMREAIDDVSGWGG